MPRLVYCVWGTIVGVLVVLAPQPALSAEYIYFKMGPLLLPLPTSALETYVNEGRITPDFAPYARQFSDQELAQLRQALQRPYAMDQVAVDRMTQTPIVEDFLQGLGQTIQTESGINGFYAMRGALILAAAESGDWTLLDVIRAFPTNIRIDVAPALKLFRSRSVSL